MVEKHTCVRIRGPSKNSGLFIDSYWCDLQVSVEVAVEDAVDALVVEHDGVL
jgi:hypothetical protein